VADVAQRVVLGEHGNVRAVAATRGDQRRFEATDPDLGTVTAPLQQFGDHSHRAMLGERRVRTRWLAGELLTLTQLGHVMSPLHVTGRRSV
jgi:hypothetical protein